MSSWLRGPFLQLFNFQSMKKLSILALLFFTISCFALTPPEVVLVVNSASTMDTDANSVPDWRDIVLWYGAKHPTWDTSQVCSVRTYDATRGDEDELWDFVSIEIDTSDDYGQPSEVNKNANHDYILDDICATWTANGWWGQKKCAVLVMGMWLRTQHNGTYGATCGQAQANSIIWSLDDIIRVFARPGFAWNSTWNINGSWTNDYRYDAIASGWLPFVPGNHYNHSYVDYNNDSLAQWLLVSRLDGLHVDDVRGMITRAASGTQITYSGGSFSTSRWAVIDQDSAGSGISVNYSNWFSDTTTIWGGPPTNAVREKLQTAFGSNILYDSVRGMPGANPDTITAHMGVSTGQQPGGSVLLYVHNNRHSVPELRANRYYTMTMPIADGALVMDLGSYNCITLRDTTDRGDLQALHAEAIQQGFTYAVGQVCEPGYELVADVRLVGDAFISPYSGIAELGHLSMSRLKLGCTLGDPLGILGRSNVLVAGSNSTGGSGWSSWR